MKHFLSIEETAKPELMNLLATAAELDQITNGASKKLPTLRGLTVFNLFFEDSTRTRISFESAAKRLSADVLNFSAKGSSVSKGESLKDTVQTLTAMGTDAIVIRHSSAGAAHRLAEAGWIDVPIINAGDGAHQHPTQALLDAYTISKHFGIGASDFSGLQVAIVGDILHSRVARSNIAFLTKMGAKVTLISSPTLLPIGVQNWPVEIKYDLDEDLNKFDVVMLLRIQMERMSDAFFPSEREYSRYFGFNSDRFTKLKASAIVMHPGPMNRGLEISSAAADSGQSKVLDQVKNGVISRMAVLYQLLANPVGGNN